jgi:alpha-glucosidase
VNNALQTFRLGSHQLLVRVVAPGIFHLRIGSGPHFNWQTLHRYQILPDRDLQHEPALAAESSSVTLLTTASGSLRIDHEQGTLQLLGPDHQPLTEMMHPPIASPGEGFQFALRLDPDSPMYGLGDVSRDHVDRRGFSADMWVTNVRSYAPSPVLMSPAGWGVYLNTTWRHYFDVGSRSADQLLIGARGGEVDFYLFAGAGLPGLLKQFITFAGRPAVLPLSAYGLTFVCNQQADAKWVIDDCLNLRDRDFPCDTVGLEPGWMAVDYDYSVDKTWHPQRFYLPPWAKDRDKHTFLAAVSRLGFGLSLWLCCDYDLTEEEERQARLAPTNDVAPKAPASFHPDDFEQDHHFGHGPVRLDKITQPGVPWFDHLKKFVDQGARAFKLDGALQVNEHPDRLYANGMIDAEAHNLYPTLLSKQMSEGFASHTGRRPFVYTSGGYAGIHRCAATWAGDTGGGAKVVTSLINHGLVAHSNVSCDMDVYSPAGIHFGFLQPWAQVCSWAYWRSPWLLGPELEPMFRFYAKLRYRLLPYLYSLAHEAHRTGVPMLRGMMLAAPDDPRCAGLRNQYMLGDALLTCAFADNVILPAGEWIDFWTASRVTGPGELPAHCPIDRGGPLWVRAGSVIVMGPDVAHTGQLRGRGSEHLQLHAWTGGSSTFTLTEDDGDSLGYLSGALATTSLVTRQEDARFTIDVARRHGEFAGMSPRRVWTLHVHAPARPVSITLDGQAVGFEWDATTRVARIDCGELGYFRCEVRLAEPS